jgi:hypothetical protein
VSGHHAVPEASHVPSTARPDGWYPDPMEPNGQRYWSSGRWTFWTSRPKTDGQPAEQTDVLERERRALGLPPPQEHGQLTGSAGGISGVSDVSDRAVGDQATPAEDASQQLRQDIATAKARMNGLGIGAGKEIRLLVGYLRPEEQVLALAAGNLEGTGVIACTNQRLLFLFKGVVRSKFVELNWNQVKGMAYDLRTSSFLVYTVKVTKRARPAVVFGSVNRKDAEVLAVAVEHAAAAPRIEMT